MKRLLLYVHYNKYDELSGHVLYQLEQLAPLFSKLIFISNSSLSTEARADLRALGIKYFILRDNRGFDFAAWRDGLQSVGFSNLAQFDSVTLMNDTCFGPLWSLEEVFDDFDKRSEVDFWGMTNFRQTDYFQEHLQSYFLTFKNQVVSSRAFQTFWSSVKDFTNVQDVIAHYETRVTTVFQDAGFSYDAVFNTIGEDATGLIHPDFSYYKPFILLDRRLPFLKVKTVKDDEKQGKLLVDQVKEISDYPIDLIKSHVNRYFSPDSLVILDDKIVDTDFSVEKVEPKHFALHVHVDNLDSLFPFIARKSDIFYVFTRGRGVTVEQLQAYLDDLNFDNVYRIVESPFDNRHTAYWTQAYQLRAYDYIGHVHTSTLTEEGKSLDNQARTIIANRLLGNLSLLEAIGTSFPDVGLVFSDLPKELYLLKSENKNQDEEDQGYSTEPHLDIFGGCFWLSKMTCDDIVNDFDKSYLPDLTTELYRHIWNLGVDYKIIASPSEVYARYRKLDLLARTQTEAKMTWSKRVKAYLKKISYFFLKK